MLTKKMFVLMTGLALLSSFEMASAAEAAGPVKLTAIQMDKVTAGLMIGDVVQIANIVMPIVVTQINIAVLSNAIQNNTAVIIAGPSVSQNHH